MWFSTIKQAQVVINTWLKQYNHIRPHQALNMKPPVPETLSYQIRLTGAIGADVRHEVVACIYRSTYLVAPPTTIREAFQVALTVHLTLCPCLISERQPIDLDHNHL